MEFANRGTLQQLVQAYRDDMGLALPERFLWHLFESLVEAIRYCHEGTGNPVIHNDIRAANIFLFFDPASETDYPIVKLGDFGCSNTLLSDGDAIDGHVLINDLREIGLVMQDSCAGCDGYSDQLRELTNFLESGRPDRVPTAGAVLEIVKSSRLKAESRADYPGFEKLVTVNTIGTGYTVDEKTLVGDSSAP
jgi:serine/threonine protein kinase